MKTRRAFLAAGYAFIALFAFALAPGDALFVQVRETQLRAAPGFLTPIVDRPVYGTALIYQSERSGWVEVTVADGDVRGWIPEGAVDENRAAELQIEGEQGSRTITTREIALAGRGFSENLEDELSDADDIDFGPVDALEAQQFDFEQVVSFVREGELREDFLGGAR